MKERVAVSFLIRLTPRGGRPQLTKIENHVVQFWERLGKATRSRLTFADLVRTCALTTAAPNRRREAVPTLSDTPVDLRPWLCDPLAIQDLLLQLQPLSPRAPRVGLLYDSECRGRANDPWFVYPAGERVPLGQDALRAVTWERIVGFTRGIVHRELQDIEEAHLAWDGPPDLAEMIIGHCRGRSGANWLYLFARLPGEVRCVEVERWRAAIPTPGHCPRDLILLAKPAWQIDPAGGAGLAYLWEGIKANAPVGQLIDGVILWRNYEWRSAPAIDASARVDLGVLSRVVSTLASPEHRSGISRETWEVLLERPALRPAFDRLLDSRADPMVKGWIYRLLREARHNVQDAGLDALVGTHYDAIEDALSAIPGEYRHKAVSLFEAVYWCGSTKMPIPRLLQVIASLCRSPLTTSDTGYWVWRSLLRDWGVEELPASSWRRIDDAWRSENHAESLKRGLELLDCETMHPIVRSGLRLRVRLTMEVIRLAGRTLPPLVARAVGRLGTHPLLELDLDTSRGIEAARYHFRDSRDLDRWSRHHSGQGSLRPEVASALRDKLDGVRCEALVRFLREELVGEAPSRGALDPHTSLYAGAADENRRIYRKLIRRYRRGGEAGILFHPRNQQWLRAHSFVKSGIWLGGVRARIRLEDGSELVLELERRFEQVLKMGTLVNSCLALDGCNSHSALANAADINKQVVMAYDGSGRFLGRQLVGIAEERRLVCFDVYSRGSRKLEAAFAAFDQRLERILSLPIHREGEYEIQAIVCRHWYDDYAWDPAEITPAEITELAWGGSRTAEPCIAS